MNPPLYSTFTLFTELIISAVLFYVLYSGYKYSRFPYKLATFAVAYEIIFNISYMVYRSYTETAGKQPGVHSQFYAGFEIFHGITSLIMFIALIIFLIAAWKSYNKGINYFRKHKTLTLAFLAFWLVAVVSGVIVYFA